MYVRVRGRYNFGVRIRADCGAPKGNGVAPAVSENARVSEHVRDRDPIPLLYEYAPARLLIA